MKPRNIILALGAVAATLFAGTTAAASVSIHSKSSTPSIGVQAPDVWWRVELVGDPLLNDLGTSKDSNPDPDDTFGDGSLWAWPHEIEGTAYAWDEDATETAKATGKGECFWKWRATPYIDPDYTEEATIFSSLFKMSLGSKGSIEILDGRDGLGAYAFGELDECFAFTFCSLGDSNLALGQNGSASSIAGTNGEVEWEASFAKGGLQVGYKGKKRPTSGTSGSMTASGHQPSSPHTQQIGHSRSGGQATWTPTPKPTGITS